MSKILFFDTNIVNFAAATKGGEPRKTAFKNYLEKLFETYEPAISCIVRYEVFSGSDMKTALKVKEFTDKLRTFEADKTVLDFAAVLATCYKNHGSVKGHNSAISDADKIIAATSLLVKDSCILTTDMNDFPRPLFVEEIRHSVSYKQEDGRQHTVEVYLLKPDLKAYRECFNRCYPKTV